MIPRVWLLTVALAAVVLLTAFPVLGQFSFKTGVDVAAFGVSVVSREGDPVAGLTPADFEVREDGVPQTVTYFSPGSADDAPPLHIGLLFDISASMEKDLAFSRNAAVRFLNLFP